MLGENHALILEYPQHKERIHQLKVSDPEFREMAKEYHQLDHQIRGLEQNQVPTDDGHFNELKMRRAQLKRQLVEML